MFAVLVVAREQRHDREALHRRGQVAAHHHAELVGLAFEAQHLALHLLVVLELGLEQLHHLDRGPGRTRDRDAGEVVGREHLVHAAVGDRVAGRRAPVAGHHDAVGVADRDHGRAVRDRRAAPIPPRRPRPAAGAGSPGAGAPRTTVPGRYGWRTAVTSSVQTSSAEPTAAISGRSAQPPDPEQARPVRRRVPRYVSAAASAILVVLELPDRDVAVPAEDAAHTTRVVVVIDVVGIRLPADRAPAALRREQLVELLERQPVLPLQVTLAVRDLLLAARRRTRPCARTCALRVLAAATCSARSMYGRGSSRYYRCARARLHALHSGR